MSTSSDWELMAITRILDEALISHAEDGNIPDSLYAIAHALGRLGNADAATRMGALEAHGAAMIEASENMSSGLHDIAEAIREPAWRDE